MGLRSKGVVAAAVAVVVGAMLAGGLRAPATAATVNVPCAVAGPSGLVAAINNANSAGGGTLNLAPNCTYLLTQRNNSTDGGNGLPVLRKAITINGANTTIARSTAAGTPRFRIFEVDKDATVAITGVTLTGGHPLLPVGGEDSAEGGAILNYGTISNLTNDTFTGNTAVIGGAISNRDPDDKVTPRTAKITTMSNAVFTANEAGNAGALFNDGRIDLITNSRFTGNRAETCSAINNGGSLKNLSNSTVSGNELFASKPITPSSGGAGAVVNELLSDLTMNSVTIADNKATNGPQAAGAGIHNSGILTLNNSTVRNNLATAQGGGIYNSTAADPTFVFTMRSTTVTGNSVTSPVGPANGAGIHNGGIMSVFSSNISQNSVAVPGGRAVGAGIYNDGDLLLSQTMLYGNTVNSQNSEAEGGGIYVDQDSTETALQSSSVSRNSATGAHPHGGGIRLDGGATPTLSGSGVSGNTPDNCFPAGSVPGCFG